MEDSMPARKYPVHCVLKGLDKVKDINIDIDGLDKITKYNFTTRKSRLYLRFKDHIRGHEAELHSDEYCPKDKEIEIPESCKINVETMSTDGQTILKAEHTIPIGVHHFPISANKGEPPVYVTFRANSRFPYGTREEETQDREKIWLSITNATDIWVHATLQYLNIPTEFPLQLIFHFSNKPAFSITYYVNGNYYYDIDDDAQALGVTVKSGPYQTYIPLHSEHVPVTLQTGRTVYARFIESIDWGYPWQQTLWIEILET